MANITIHGKEYTPVSDRIQEAHKECKTLSITTELLPADNKIVIKATVVTPKGTFTGISAANESKLIEKTSPYEVAETSAIGRALGFAGYGIVNGIASADEISKALSTEDKPGTPTIPTKCSNCGTSDIPQTVLDYSLNVFNKPICYKCQTELRKQGKL